MNNIEGGLTPKIFCHVHVKKKAYGGIKDEAKLSFNKSILLRSVDT